MRPVPPGQPGELFIGGDGVTRGYLKRPESDGRALPSQSVHHARVACTVPAISSPATKAAAIQFLGRVDHQVKVRGYRIELGEIETHIATHASVAEAVVVVRAGRAQRCPDRGLRAAAWRGDIR